MNATFSLGDHAQAGAPAADGAGGGRRLWERAWVRWAAVFGGWTVLACLFTSQLYYSRVLSERPMTWRDAASTQFIYPYLWACGTLVVLWLAGRYPVEGARRWRNLLLHVFFATLFAVLITGTFQILNHFVNGTRRAGGHQPII